MTNRERMLERNTDRIDALTPDQIDAVHYIMAINIRYRDELMAAVLASGAEGPTIQDDEIKAALHTMAGTLQVTMALDAVLTEVTS
jgi:hypothetical protein